MSIIGTRPPLISETNLYELHHRARLAIKPGITGMWQVSGRSDITDFEEVVRLDKEYITNWNIGLDIKILFKTILVECCGHLSAFEIDGVSYEREPDDDFGWGEPAKSTNHTLKQVLTTGMIFNYEYDFGSTTEIMVKVLDHYSAQKQNEKVVILSRNNPPEFACSICGNSRGLKRERFFH